MAGPFDPYHRWLGIPPSDQPPNHYRLLGLQLFEGDADVIESAADQRMGHLRTFQTGKHGKLSQRLLNEVAGAKICLLNPQKRAAYDKLLRQKLATKAADAKAPRAEEPADSQLAGFFAQSDRDTLSMRSQAAARKKPAKLGLLIGAAALAGLLILGLILRGTLSTAETALVLHWPEDQRKGATLKIDEKPFVVESSGPLQHRCGPGEHRIRAGRPGFEPFVETVTLEEGQTKTVRPVWQKAAEEGPPPSAPPVVGTDKTPPDKPAETPSDGTTSVGGPPTPPVEPGDGSPQEKPGDEPPKVAVEPGVSEPDQPPPPVEPERLPVPSAEVQQQVAAQLEEVYRLSGLKTPQQKLQSARELFDLGKKSKEDPTERFVLLRTASELARDGGDAALMLEAVEAIGADYDVDVLSVKQKFLVKFAEGATNSQRIGSLVENSLPLVDQALAQRGYELAYELIDAAYRACTHTAGKKYRKQIYDRRGEVQKPYQAWKRFQDALATLIPAPDDADANLIVGEWRCFKEGDWEQGLPHLAKGSNEGLKTVARQELDSPPANSAAQIKLADAWWDLAQTAKGETKDALLLHAGTWYERAQPNVTLVLTKDKLAKRLAKIAKIGRPPPVGPRPPPAVAPFPPQDLSVEPIDIAAHPDGVTSIAYSPDGRHLVSVCLDQSVRVWDTATWQEIRQLSGPNQVIQMVITDANGRMMRVREKVTEVIRQVTFSPDGRRLLSTGYSEGVSRTIRLWDFPSGRPVCRFQGLPPLRGVAFSPHGKLVLSGSADGTVFLWHVDTGRVIVRYKMHTRMSGVFAFSSDGRRAFSGGWDPLAKHWEVTTGKVLQIFDCGSAVGSLALSPDGRSIFTGSKDQLLRQWDLESGRELRRFVGTRGTPHRIAISPDGCTLLSTGATDSAIRVWDVATGQQLRSFQVPPQPGKVVVISPDGSHAVWGSSKEKQLHLWPPPKGPATE